MKREDYLMAREKITGSEIVIKALSDQNVEEIFGYPGQKEL